jgi:hypothetical protein
MVLNSKNISILMMLAAELIDGGDMSCLWTNAGWNNEILPTTGALYYTSQR